MLYVKKDIYQDINLQKITHWTFCHFESILKTACNLTACVSSILVA